MFGSLLVREHRDYLCELGVVKSGRRGAAIRERNAICAPRSFRHPRDAIDHLPKRALAENASAPVIEMLNENG
jgi:hypothetical protein